MSSPLQDIFHRGMSRKEFLVVLGLGLCSLFGMDTIGKLLSTKPSSSSGISTLGYNGGVYGGKRTL
jgi:hypothetical protein